MRAEISSEFTCKAVVIHDAGRASLDTVVLPTVGAGDVVIEVAYVGVCVTDLEIVGGSLGYYKKQIARYPIVPGHEVSGRVARTGVDVTELKPGDEVVVECIQGCGQCAACRHESPIGCEHRAELGVIGTGGGYSEFVVVPARFVHRITPSIDLKTAVLCEPLAVVLKGLDRLANAWGQVPKVKRCAVVGAGPLGRLCAGVLTHRGHSVILFDHDERRLTGLSKQIATSGSLEGLNEFDAIVEATGQQPALDVALERSRAGATLLLLGLPYDQTQLSFESIVAYDKTVIGSVGSGPAEFEAALELLPQLETAAFTANVLPLEDFQQAWNIARTRSQLKVLLAPGNGQK